MSEIVPDKLNLSERARRIMAEQGMARQRELVGSPDELRAALLARGWPVYDSVLDLEERGSGLRFFETGPGLGCWAALQRRARERVARDDELLRWEGKVLLPIFGGQVTNFWMDDDGVCYDGVFSDFAYEPWDGDECEPSYASFEKFLERWAFKRHLEHSKENEALRIARKNLIRTFGSAGRSVAEALGAPLDAIASDHLYSFWIGEALVTERTHRSQTDAWLSTRDECVSVLRTLALVAGHVRVDPYLQPAPPHPGEPPVERLRLLIRGNPGEISIYGQSGDYRFEVKR
ncbi:MAG TPA: hypothetical protein VH083_28180 [Myxococcales bacterium]|jgi:hypothetical protein|nr:hypothetical protein [Myxococcales bacterium]